MSAVIYPGDSLGTVITLAEPGGVLTFRGEEKRVLDAWLTQHVEVLGEEKPGSPFSAASGGTRRQIGKLSDR